MASLDANRNNGNVIAFIDVDQEETSSDASSMLKKRKLSPQKHKKTKRTKRSTDDIVGPTITQPNMANDSTKCCWICHLTDAVLCCCYCKRKFHKQCLDSFYSDLQLQNDPLICPECVLMMIVDCHNYGGLSHMSHRKSNQSHQSIRQQLKYLPHEQLKESLLYIVLRLFHYNGASHFQEAVDERNCKDYYKIIKYPMYLSLLKQNIEDDKYFSVQHFYSDFKWIYHNCFIYNGDNYMTSCARNLDSLCAKEINFLESCPRCFLNRLPFMVKLLKDHDSGKPKHKWRFSFDSVPVKELWMTELCNILHPLVWVRLQGYPTWPGKLLNTGEENALVLFFGDYDLNIVPIGSMYMHTQSNTKLKSNSSFESQSVSSEKQYKSVDITSTSRSSTNAQTPSNTTTVLAPGPTYQGILKEYNLAIDQLNKHIENIKSRYVYFVEPPKKYENNITKGIDYYRKVQNTNNHHNNNNHSSVTTSSSSVQRSVSKSSREKKSHKQKLEIIQTVERNVNNAKSLTAARSSFFDSFENNFMGLLNEFKKSYWESFSQQLSTTPTSTPMPILENCNLGPIKLKTDLTNKQESQCSPTVDNLKSQIVKVDNTVQTELEVDKSIDKVSEIDTKVREEYINYLENKLVISDAELRRQEILSIIRHEEHVLESTRQQRELRRIYESDMRSIIEQCATKFKSNEWCAFCGKSALFYCCWNTCYCNSECQGRHWPTHRSTCVQLAKQQQYQQVHQSHHQQQPNLVTMPKSHKLTSNIHISPANNTSSHHNNSNSNSNINTVHQQPHPLVYQHYPHTIINNVRNNSINGAAAHLPTPNVAINNGINSNPTNEVSNANSNSTNVHLTNYHNRTIR